MKVRMHRAVRVSALIAALFLIAGPPEGGHYVTVAAQDRASRTFDFWFEIPARQDGSFTVTNARNGFSKTYAAR